jgi:cytochrome c1
MRISLSLFLACAALLHVGCSASAKQAANVMTNGDADRGASAIDHYGCGSCHTIPGISGANTLVGPDLSRIGSRIYIAGSLDNEPVNMIQWLQDPHAINPKTVMPTMGVTERDARDIAAYLYSLK